MNFDEWDDGSPFDCDDEPLLEDVIGEDEPSTDSDWNIDDTEDDN